MKIEFAKVLPIVLSIFALAVSCLSWLESRRNRIINEEINRPILQSDKVVVDAGWNQGSGWISFHARIKNTGKSTANLESFEIKPFIVPTMVHKDCKIGKDIDQFHETQKVEILVGSNHAFGHAFELPLSCRELPGLPLFIETTADYTDSGSGKQYSQKFQDLLLWTQDERK